MFFEHLDSTTAHAIETRFPVLREAFAWIRAMPAHQPDGITELRGTDMYVNVHGYATLPAPECRWESHRHTIDVQYCISGGEQIEWLPSGALRSMDDYNAAKDAEHWHASEIAATRLSMFAGAFVVFLPGELHRPKIADSTHADVRKLVVKIHAALLQS